MFWLRLMPVLLAVAIACGPRSLDPDAGTGIIQTGNGGAAGGSTGSTDARPEIPTIITTEPTLCGNGRLDPAEECDDANKVQGDGCSAICQIECYESCGRCGTGRSCATNVCGNGRLEARETCDDGNVDPGDGCSGDCVTVEPGWRCPVMGRRCAPICGDGRVIAPEGCDDGNATAGDGCNEFCELEPTLGLCGDGSLQGSEECDFGIQNNDNVYEGCTTQCRWGLSCGDGVRNGPEDCDLGAAQNRARYGNTGGCTAFCTLPHFCGDGHPDVENGEQCDLGPNNGTDGHPCTKSCQICVDCV